MRTRRGSARVAAAPLGGPKGGRVPPRRGEGFDRTTPWSREPRRFVGSAWGRGTRRHAENARPPPEGDPGGRRGVMAPLSCANGAKSPGFNPPGRRRPWGPREGGPGDGAKPPGSGGRGQRRYARGPARTRRRGAPGRRPERRRPRPPRREGAGSGRGGGPDPAERTPGPRRTPGPGPAVLAPQPSPRHGGEDGRAVHRHGSGPTGGRSPPAPAFLPQSPWDMGG